MFLLITGIPSISSTASTTLYIDIFIISVHVVLFSMTQCHLVTITEL